MSPAARDAVVTVGLVLAFAALVSAHVASVFGLGRRRRVREALEAAVLPPLAPYLAFTCGMRVRAVVWLGSAALYAAALALSR